MIPSDFGWSDVGSWNALYDLAEKDKDGNYIVLHLLKTKQLRYLRDTITQDAKNIRFDM